jgi:hypothetical protein
LGNKHTIKAKYGRRRAGKVDTPFNKQLKNVRWGKIGFDKLFKVCPVKNKLTKIALDNDGKTPVYSSESNNNGIIGYTNNEAEFVVNKDNPIYIIFGDHTRSFNIAAESFCVMDNVKVLSINETLTIRVLIFIISSWKKCIPNKGYSRHWSIAKNVLFNLPLTQDNKIDFVFIENFVKELEAIRIDKLDTYLLDSNLKDYQLTKEEQKLIDAFPTQVFEKFNVIKVFDIKNTGNILSRDITPNSGVTPYLCASSENNGVSSYISYDKKYIDKGNCVFIGGKTFVVSFQEKDFFSNDSHNLVLYVKEEKNRTKLNQLYLATCINKSLGYKYSWGDSISSTKIKKDKVSLPALNKQPAYEILESFISGIQKLVIKDLVLYVESKTRNTKNILTK